MFSLESIKFKTTVTKIALIAYIGCGILGFFHVLQMTSMSIHIDDCPFSHILQAVGDDAVSSHLQILNLPIVTVLTLLEIGLCFAALLYLFPHYRLQKILTILPYFDGRRNRLRHTLYTSLFSDGLLNPKIF